MAQRFLGLPPFPADRAQVGQRWSVIWFAVQDPAVMVHGLPTVPRGLQGQGQVVAGRQMAWLQIQHLLAGGYDPGQVSRLRMYRSLQQPEFRVGGMFFACVLACVHRLFEVSLADQGLYALSALHCIS